MDFKTLIVTIFVPTSAGDGEGEIATGFPVGKDLILTAGHLLSKDRDPDLPIQMRWHAIQHRQHESADDSGWLSLDEDAIVRPNDETLDAVLLRCPFPTSVKTWGELTYRRPNGKTHWESMGFPDATKRDDIREACDFDGECYRPSHRADYFQVMDKAGPDTETAWKGASGMPIYAEDRVYGIAKSVPRNFRAKRLNCTPAWRILDQENFRAELGIDDRNVVLQSVTKALTQHLYDAVAIDAFLSALSKRSNYELPKDGLEKSEKATKLIELMLKQVDILVVFLGLREGHKALLDAGARESAQELQALAWILAPILMDRSLTAHAEGQLGSALVELPVGTVTVAELIMAGLDNRSAMFMPRKSDDDLLQGALLIQAQPEGGRSTDDKSALAEHVLSKLAPPGASYPKLRQQIDEHMIDRFKRDGPGLTNLSREARIKLAGKVLEWHLRDTGQRYYMVFWPETEEERQAFETLAEGLMDDYPSLVCLSLNPDQKFEDMDLVDPLCRMMPLVEN